MGFLERFRRTEFAAPALDGDVRAAVIDLVHAGFWSRAEVLQAALEIYEEDLGQASRSALDDLVQQVWDARLQDQASWPVTTDADRLEAAFAGLDAAGIVARMCFTCCQSCGTSEIADEVAEGRTAHGYVFFHSQDAERLAEPEATLLLSYGPLNAPDAESRERLALAVGDRVQTAVQRQGLTVSWNRSAAQRIAVTGLQWQRRLPT